MTEPLAESLTTHPKWPFIQPVIVIEHYDRDGGHKHPRPRIEIAKWVTPAVGSVLMELVVACARCGKPMHPIRQREGTGRPRWYVAVTCGLTEDGIGCARGTRAHEAVERIVALCEGNTPPLRMFPLFEEAWEK